MLEIAPPFIFYNIAAGKAPFLVKGKAGKPLVADWPPAGG
jgi:hypothetical protein